MQEVFTHPQGQTHLYQLALVKSDGTPGASSTPMTYAVDNPAIATVTANTAVAGNLQCTVNYLTPGTATITYTGTNEIGQPFSNTFQCIVTAVTPVLTIGATVTEIS